MRAIRYTLLILLACLTLGSCQDIEEPMNTIPTVVTDAVEKYYAEFAYLSGSVSSRAECYFMIATSKDMNEAQRFETYMEYSQERDTWLCQTEVGDLQPGTTYYVVLCATDGRSEVKGNIVSFTTLERLSIASVTYTPWGEESAVDFVHETALGGFLFYDNLQGKLWQSNMMMPYDFDNTQWSLPELDFFQGDMAMITYWPYQQNASPWKFVVYSGTTDYMYSTCEGLNATHLAADIHLSHIMAKVKFDIRLEGKNTINGTINRVVIGNHINSEAHHRYDAIPWEGALDMTTGTLMPIYNNSHDGLWAECSIKPSTEVQSVERYMVPAKFGKDMAYVELRFDNGYILPWTFGDISWESGYEYTYPLTITENGLIVGDVIVEEWHDNDEGKITINK